MPVPRRIAGIDRLSGWLWSMTNTNPCRPTSLAERLAPPSTTTSMIPTVAPWAPAGRSSTSTCRAASATTDITYWPSGTAIFSRHHADPGRLPGRRHQNNVVLNFDRGMSCVAYTSVSFLLARSHCPARRGRSVLVPHAKTGCPIGTTSCSGTVFGEEYLACGVCGSSCSGTQEVRRRRLHEVRILALQKRRHLVDASGTDARESQAHERTRHPGDEWNISGRLRRLVSGGTGAAGAGGAQTGGATGNGTGGAAGSSASGSGGATGAAGSSASGSGGATGAAGSSASGSGGATGAAGGGGAAGKAAGGAGGAAGRATGGVEAVRRRAARAGTRPTRGRTSHPRRRPPPSPRLRSTSD